MYRTYKFVEIDFLLKKMDYFMIHLYLLRNIESKYCRLESIRFYPPNDYFAYHI